MPINLKTDPPVATLFSEDAEEVAKMLDSKAKDDRGRDSGKNKSTQIRRFYDELVSWQDRIGVDAEKFKQYEAFVKMLNAKAAYAKGRNLVTQDFVDWFRDCVNQVNSPKSLYHFRLHFEAMLGFLKSIRG
ncbi:MAG TPA: type III-A CRISPR-associated protein Csm2 [Rhodocyclaceae bacterium]|nr:type III-A CRISPR-associated protein Csm2 [Rhodocyclaceae bacterium]